MSDSEGFGLVFIEAFYYGVPVVSFDCPVSPREVIGDAGILVPCFDENEYADAVVAKLSETEDLRKSQRSVINRAKLFYSNIIAKHWNDLLTSM